MASGEYCEDFRLMDSGNVAILSSKLFFIRIMSRNVKQEWFTWGKGLVGGIVFGMLGKAPCRNPWNGGEELIPWLNPGRNRLLPCVGKICIRKNSWQVSNLYLANSCRYDLYLLLFTYLFWHCLFNIKVIKPWIHSCKFHWQKLQYENKKDHHHV